MRRRLLVLIVLAGWATTVQAQPTFVQGGITAVSGTSVTLTFGATLTSGNFVICTGGQGSQATTLAISNAGTALTWQTVTGAPWDHSGGTGRAYLWYAQITASNVTSATVTRSSGSTTISMSCAEFAGMAAASELDQVGEGETAAVQAHDITGTVTTTQADEVLFAVGHCTTTATWSAGAFYSLTAASSLAHASEWRIVSVTGSYSSPFTTSANETCQIAMATFRADAVAPPPITRQLLTLGVGGDQ